MHGTHVPEVEFLNVPTGHRPWHVSPSTHGWHFNAAACRLGSIGLNPGRHLAMQLSMFSAPALVNVARSLPMVHATHRGTTGQLRFCKLQAIASGIDGSYVILADGATVLRYDLFTDLEKGNIRQLDASVVPTRAL